MPREFSNRKLEKFPHSAAVSVPAEASAVCSCPFGTTKSNSNISDMDKAWASIIQQESQLCRESSMPEWTPHGPQWEKLCILYYWASKSLNLSMSRPSGARSIACSSWSCCGEYSENVISPGCLPLCHLSVLQLLGLKCLLPPREAKPDFSQLGG